MPHFKLNCSLSWLFDSLNTLYILDTNSDICVSDNYFFQFFRLLICGSRGIICCIKTFESHEAHLLIVGLIAMLSRSCIKSCFLCQWVWPYIYFLFYHIQVIRPMLKSSVCLELCFVLSKIYGPTFIFLHLAIQLDQHKDYLFSNVYIVGFFVKNKVGVGVCIFMLLINSILLTNESFLPVPCCFSITWDWGWWYFQQCVIIVVHDCFDDSGSLAFPYKI